MPTKSTTIKKIATITSLFICVMFMFASGYYLQDKRSLSIEVVDDLVDEEGTGILAKLNVKLTNNGPKVIEPRFSVVWGEYPYYWSRENGPEILDVGQSAFYSIYADQIGKGIPNKQTFIVRVNDVHSGAYFSSDPIRLYLKNVPIILNSKFKYWTTDHSTSVDRPVEWEVAPLAHWGAKAYSSHEVIDNENVLGMTVYRDGIYSDWATMHVKQTIKFSNKTIGLSVYPTFSYEGGNDPHIVFGVEINDELHTIWYVFSDKNEGTYKVSNYHRVIVTKTPLNQWSYREINFYQQYQEFGWETPRYVKFICIVGSKNPGTYYGYIKNIVV